MISLQRWDPEGGQRWKMQEDIDAAQENFEDQEAVGDEPFTPLFDPLAFQEEYKPLTLEEYRLDEAALREHGKTATLIRKKMDEKVLMLQPTPKEDKQEGSKDQSRVGMIYSKRYSRLSIIEAAERRSEEAENALSSGRRKKRQLKELMALERAMIVRSVLVAQESQKEVALRHRLSPASVHRLLASSSRDPHHL